MWIFFDFIFLLIALIYLPVYLFRKKFRFGFLARLGFLPRGLRLDGPVWIHAVSVGEAMALKQLIAGLRRAYPQKKLVISTVTATGNKIASALAGAGDFVTYLPLDFSFIVARAIAAVKPCLFVVAETEIWPNLITRLHQSNIPQIVVNGRISDRSLRGYLRAKFLFSPLLNRIDLFCVQSQRDAQRLRLLGLRPDKIEVTGNMKFDSSDYADDKDDCADLKLRLGIKTQDRLWIAGSTHPKEEAFILQAYRDLLKDFPDLRLLIAPRHPERAEEVGRIAGGFGFPAVFISNLASIPYNPPPVFILDTVGALFNFYRLADIVFVGGSLVKKGGHNILEPAALGKPVLFGPHMFNFRDIADLFLEHQAAVCVEDTSRLGQAMAGLLKDPSQAQALGSKAQGLMLRNRGATEKTLACIETVLKGALS